MEVQVFTTTPSPLSDCVWQHSVAAVTPSPRREPRQAVTRCQFNLACQFMESLIATLLYLTVK